MKKLVTVLCSILLLSCSKNSSSTGGSAFVDYSGTYKGNINVSVNGSASSTLTDYSIVVDELGNGIVTLSNNVFAGNTGLIKNATLTLDNHRIAVSPTYDKSQYGTATFTASFMTIDFHEDDVQQGTNTVLNTKVWTGVLVKQ